MPYLSAAGNRSDPAGFYQLCYLGVATGSEAPLNSLGPFELAEVIHSVAAASNPGSDRNTLRLTLEVRMPGTVTCLARKTGTVSAADFSSGVLYEGRASMLIPTVEAGMDPEFPRTFSLLLPLVEYQRVAEPMRVWCLHSLADTAVFPDGDGALIPLEDKEPFVTARPQFLWTSAKFRLTLSNTPPVNGKQLAMHAPALPFGWSRQLVTEDGAQVLRYVSPTGQVLAEHPRYTEWLNGERLDLCLGANASRALDARPPAIEKRGHPKPLNSRVKP
ncbi:unnamed protein product [Effrenium voratum]|nr:unnamed protein product [Effrenium voratum]